MMAIKAYDDYTNPNRVLTPLEKQIERSLREGEEIELEEPRIQTPISSKYYYRMIFKEVINKVKTIGILSIHISGILLLRTISKEISLDLE